MRSTVHTARLLPILTALAAVVLSETNGVSGQTPPPTPTSIPLPAANNLAIKYVRDSEEYGNLSGQVYRLAGNAVERSTKPSRPTGWAVVLDIDETTLDNSAYQLERAAYGLPFTSPSWRAWVRRVQSPAIPGVKDFADRVRRIEGARIAWITDREGSADPALDLTGATKENLRSVGVWNEADVLCMRLGNTKKDRRAELAAGSGVCSWPGTKIQVLVFLGDQMGDFPGKDEPGENGSAAFGDRFFLLPNPMYGAWVSAVTKSDIR